MRTRFKLIFESEEPNVDLPRFRRSSPSDFEISVEDDRIYITIASQNLEDEQCQYLVKRELDCHFFFDIREDSGRNDAQNGDDELRYQKPNPRFVAVLPQAISPIKSQDKFPVKIVGLPIQLKL